MWKNSTTTIDLTFQEYQFPKMEVIGCPSGRYIHVVCAPDQETVANDRVCMSLVILRSPHKEDTNPTAHLAQSWLRHVNANNPVDIYEYFCDRSTKTYFPSYQTLNEQLYA